MNLARNVRIVVENPYFTVTRFVATPAELTVGEMIIIVHAALGLEPSSPGQLMVREDEEPIDIFPIIDSDFYTSFGEDVHYHPSEGRLVHHHQHRRYLPGGHGAACAYLRRRSRPSH